MDERNDKEKQMTDKTIEEASNRHGLILVLQAQEARRDDCTVLVNRLHLKSTEKDVFRFFSNATIGRIRDIKIIRDQRTGKAKGAAYVEFESQESVLLAAAMSDQPILGKYFSRLILNSFLGNIFRFSLF